MAGFFDGASAGADLGSSVGGAVSTGNAAMAGANAGAQVGQGVTDAASAASTLPSYLQMAGTAAGTAAQISQYQNRALPVYGPDGSVRSGGVPANSIAQALQTYLNHPAPQQPGAASFPGASLDVASYQSPTSLMQTLASFASQAGRKR
jgi:hypothetical protein